MSDTPNPTPIGDQPEEAANVQAFAPPTEAQPEADDVTSDEVQAEAAVGTEPDPQRPPTLEERLGALGPAGAILLDTFQGLVGGLEQVGAPALVAGVFGVLFDANKEPGRVEFGCLASHFGNDLLLKGMMGTIAEQQSARNQEDLRRRRQSAGGPSLQAILAALQQPPAQPEGGVSSAPEATGPVAAPEAEPPAEN